MPHDYSDDELHEYIPAFSIVVVGGMRVNVPNHFRDALTVVERDGRLFVRHGDLVSWFARVRRGGLPPLGSSVVGRMSVAKNDPARGAVGRG
jgi:hypothetical protein